MQILTYDTVNTHRGEARIETDLISGDTIHGFDTVIDGDGNAGTRIV